MQEAVYSSVKTLLLANKWLISGITRVVRDIAGDMEEISLNHHFDSSHEQSVIGCSVSSTGTVNWDSTSGDNLHLFPAYQPITNHFLNHNKSSYNQEYDLDRSLPFGDPIALEEGPDIYVEGAVEETSPASPHNDSVDTTPVEVQLLT
eukprot:4574966-Ditylum_brightwellii.AAC.1